MTAGFASFFQDENFAALISVLDEMKASPEEVRKLNSEEKQQLSQSIKDAIWQRLPQLGKIKDNPGNVECNFWIGKLFGWDWSRIELLGSFDERAKGLAAFAYDPNDGPLIRGYLNIVKYFMQRYVALGGTENETEARSIAGLEIPPPKTVYGRLLEKEKLIPIASKDNPVDKAEKVVALMKRRAELQDEFTPALEHSEITKEQFGELTCLNRLHGLGLTDMSQVPAPLRSLFDDCVNKDR